MIDLLRRTARRFARGGASRQPPGEPTAATAEIGWADGLFFGRVPMERWNPDELVWRHGYPIYRRMLRDDQLRALLSLRQAVIAARAWRFEPAADTPAQTACGRFLRHLLTQRLEGTFTQALGDLLSSQAYGFSLLEKVYAPVRWEGRTLWGVRALKLRPAESFAFEADVHGNATALLQEQQGVRVPLPRERFVHHVNKPEAHPLYGESDLRECHRHWWAKDNILKFWNIYLERMAAGFVHGRISGPLSASEREELKQVLRHLSTQTSIVTPASVELSMVTAPSTDAFERAVAARDKAMAKALLVPNLLGFSEQGAVGSYSQSRTQQETFFLAMNRLAESVADTLNEQLFRELAWWNFGLADPPRFVFEPLSDAQKRDYARAWNEAVQAGTASHGPADEARVRALLGFPAAADEPGARARA